MWDADRNTAPGTPGCGLTGISGTDVEGDYFTIVIGSFSASVNILDFDL